MPDEDPEKIYLNNGRVKWRCQYCPKRYLELGGTSAIIVHLKSHEKYEKSSNELCVLQVQATLQH